MPENLFRPNPLSTFVRALIRICQEVLDHPTNKRLVLAFAEQLPTASWTILQLVEDEDRQTMRATPAAPGRGSRRCFQSAHVAAPCARCAVYGTPVHMPLQMAVFFCSEHCPICAPSQKIEDQQPRAEVL